MLIAAVLTLRPLQPATLPANLGRATHAWFLSQVRAADHTMAETLHQADATRPFTLSNLWGTERPSEGQITLSPEQTYFLRLTSFLPELSVLLREQVLSSLPETIELTGVPLRLMETTTDPAQHPWAGTTTFEELIQEHTLALRSPPPRLILRFASPTVFRSSGVNVPLPLPALVFGSLLQKWNAFAPLRLPSEVRRFAEKTMVVSRYRLRTERVVFGEEGEREAYPGFVGMCSYSFRVRDRYWMGLIHLLAAFALYAGVGARTTMGLGQTKPQFN
ncbi:MAG TPA: CRISPR-associated endoribonuclease Cas6 [Anaerolineae bacterium]|nr:CRISPR-associated endoribonuclease Cas6 [Anaerolineae bacterium]